MRKILLVFGTRPEAIKMCPLVNELKAREGVEARVCVTGQHREMLDQVLEVFDVVPDHDLAIMKPGQDLFSITVDVLEGMRGALEEERPDVVLVHGDATTSFAAAHRGHPARERVRRGHGKEPSGRAKIHAEAVRSRSGIMRPFA